LKEFWDQRYEEEDFVYGTEPNIFFQETLDGLNPATLLLPGEGEGRNAIYASRKGWEVTAWDQSKVARDKALTWARQENLSIKYQLVQLEKLTACKQKYDAIGVIYLHFPPDLRKVIFGILANCLYPGGKIILECFHKNQLNLGTGGPPVEEMLYNEEDLLGDFKLLDIELCKEKNVDIFEGKYHSGESSVIRLIANRPI
jgi:SAM-dependent methyltransferase